jgi:hypothetical protein
LIKLPTGSIKPKGWLRKQLELEADGFTGHLTEISGFCHKEGNAWRSPYGEGGASWEEVPYWFRGYAALGYVLDDQKIIKEAQPWIEAAIATQAEFGYFGPTANLNAPIHPPLPAELLTTADGKPGLDAEYFDGVDFKTSKLKRVDANIDFDWGMKPPIDGLKSTDYSIRWTGRLTAKETGEYIFSLYSDDGAKLWIDNVLIVDNGGSHAPLTVTAKKALRLEAGKPHELKIEYFQGINGAEIRLGWKKPGGTYQPRNIIPDLMPNMNMVYALMFYQEYTGDKRVIDLLKKYFQWQLQIPDKMFFSGGWQVPRNGDNLDAIYWLYNRTGEPLMSYSRGGPDPYEAMFDGKTPRHSNDHGVSRFTTYCFGGAENGKLHWVRRNFDQEKTVSSCEVYWVDEASPPGDVRLPKAWRVLYLIGKEWKEVENPSGYGIAPDKSNTVTFKPVKTTALRLDVQCQEGRAMGIYEWQLK